MSELKDYSGPFNPNLKLEDLSKEMIMKLVKEYQRAYLVVLGEWHRVMKERFGDVQAIECDNSQWMVAGPMVASFLCRAAKIKPANVESFFKQMQIDPGFPMEIFEMEWELVNPDLGYITVKRCTALMMNEMEGKGYEIPMCHVEECPTMINTAFIHNRNLVFRPVKMPPRKNPQPTDIACKWEAKVVKPEENPFPHWDASKRMRPGVPHDPKEAGKPWTEEQIRVMWGYLNNDSRKVMRLIAKKPTGYLMEDLVKNLGISAEDVSFHLGFQYLAIFETPWPQKWAPVRYLLNPWRYEMDREWAQLIPKLV
jgi:hypothetical protein